MSTEKILARSAARLNLLIAALTKISKLETDSICDAPEIARATLSVDFEDQDVSEIYARAFPGSKPIPREPDQKEDGWYANCNLLFEISEDAELAFGENVQLEVIDEVIKALEKRGYCKTL